jgi:serine phosphatase RsbU (regulator of sigma subunit)
MKKRHLSLEAQLALIVSLVLILVSTTLFIELAARERAKLISAKTTAASMLTQLLANELAAAVDFEDADDATASLNFLRFNPDIVGAAVWSWRESAEPIAGWTSAGAPASSRPGADEPDGASASSEWLVATRTIVGQRNRPVARVRVVFTLRPENDAFRSNRRQLFWMTGGLSALAALLLALLARRYVVGPIQRLASAATALADGDLSARVDIRTANEIGDLARAFNVMGEAVAFRQERLQKEIDLAQRIQTSILPRSLEVPGLELAAIMLPTAEVGGDYYDVLPVERGCWIGIGDVAGHGLDAGLIMLMTQSIVAALIKNDTSATPKDVVCVLNEVLYDNLHNRLRRDDHATLTLLHYDRSGKVLFAGAHEDIVVYRQKEERCEIVPTPGTWIGGGRDIRKGTVDSTLRLSPGDVMLLYTDGVIELRNDTGEPFGLERLCAVLKRVHDQSVAKIQEHLLLAIGSWGIADDDVTIMVARYVGE